MSFLVAGVQKGGTTALDDYLREHPELQMATPKETHFFDDESVDWSDPDYSRYDRFYGADDGRLRGDATPIYVYWPGSLERAQRYRPEMKLILLFRDPVERAWSHWRMERDRGWDSQPFSWCIREGRERVAANKTPPGHHRVFSYVERGFYGRQLERVLGLFPRGQLLLLRSDELRAEPERVVNRVCDFLEVRRPDGPLRRRELNVGRSDSLSGADADYLCGIYWDDLTRFAALSGMDVEPWLTSPGAQAARSVPR